MDTWPRRFGFPADQRTARNTNAYGDGHCHGDLHTDANARGKSNTDRYCYGDVYAYCDSDSDVYANAYSDGHVYANTNTGGEPNTNSYSDGYSFSDANTDSYSHAQLCGADSATHQCRRHKHL